MVTLDEIKRGLKGLVSHLNRVGHEAAVRNAPEGFVDLYVNGKRSCTYVRLCPTGKAPSDHDDPRIIEADNWATMRARAIAELGRLFQEEVQEPFLL